MAGIMLPVAIDLDRDLIRMLLGVHVAGLHRSADSQIERKSENRSAGARSTRCRAVRGAVVDDDDVELGRPLMDLVDGRGDRSGFVMGGDDG